MPWWEKKEVSKTYSLLYHFYTCYAVYLLLWVMIFGVAVWLAEAGRISFVQALYTTMSAATMTGLSCINFAELTFVSQALILVEIILCSSVLMTLVPVVFRARSFRAQMRHLQRAYHQDVQRGLEMHRQMMKNDEYNALTWLFLLVSCYWIFWEVVGWLVLWFAFSLREGSDGEFWTACWHALFTTTSAFQNNGLSVLPNGLPWLDQPVHCSEISLTMVAILILVGNSCYPIFLRLLVMKIHLLTRFKHRGLRLLLEDPRRCYTHLFPNYATSWLTVITASLILAQVMGLLLSENVGTLMFKDYSFKEKLSAAAFDSVACRTGGMSVSDLSKMTPPCAFIFCVCMWISASPVVVALRTTASSPLPVYDISGAHLAEAEHQKPPHAPTTKEQVTNFMSENSIVLVCLFFVILVVEWDHTHKDTLLVMIFEFCSAWGTVGLSMSSSAAAVSGSWAPTAQLALMVVMFLGRLRGLPHSIDPSVSIVFPKLPPEEVENEEVPPPHGAELTNVAGGALS